MLDLPLYVVAGPRQQRRKFAVHAVTAVHLGHKVQHLEIIFAHGMPQAPAKLLWQLKTQNILIKQ